MTDAELAKSVAEACGIEVKEHNGFLWLTNGTEFTPATSWNSAMFAAEKCGLFDENTHRGRLQRHEGEWWMEFALGDHFRDARRNDSGPRAICEAILAVAKERV